VSAIGSYVRMRASDLDRLLEQAAAVTSDRPFRWPWQPRAESSRERFEKEWDAATLEEVVFDGSGHVLGHYFLAQSELHDVVDPFDSAEAASLARVFTAAFAARVPQELRDFDEGALKEFCTEWGDEAAAIHDGIVAAHAFFKEGMARIRDGEAVVFLIS
jgi:hypothetical protein